MVTRVVKLGGSLLELSDWAERLWRWLSIQSSARNLIVVGGGERVEALRTRQLREGFDDELAHVEALQLMDFNAAEVAQVMPRVRLVRDWRPDSQIDSYPVAVLECGQWACGEQVFERSWGTTSDSVAAEIASRINADELVLLKSCLPKEFIASVVDPRFEHHVRPGQLVRVVNLQDAAFPEFTRGKAL